MGSNFEDEQDDYSQDGESENIPALSPSRLIEGVRDTLLTWYKQAAMNKPWPQMSEQDQRIWINRIEERAEKLVTSVVDHVATGQFPVVHAKIDSFQIKGGEVKITAKGFADDAVLLTLNHAGPKAVKIIVADGEQFDESRQPLNPDPDQPGLPGVKDGDDEDEPGFIDEDDPAPEPEIENPADEQTQGEEVLKPKSAEWRGGYNSHLGGHKRNENPFNVSTQLEAFTDWHAGWDAAGQAVAAAPAATDGDPSPADPAPAEDNKQIAEGQMAFAAGIELSANPYKQKAKKDDWERGWLQASNAKRKGPAVEPDIEPEEDADPVVGGASLDPVEEPAVEDADIEVVNDIPNQDGEVIETEEQAHAFGMFCRKDGKGTGSNPFGVGTDFYKAWLRGYNDAKKAEAKDF